MIAYIMKRYGEEKMVKLNITRLYVGLTVEIVSEIISLRDKSEIISTSAFFFFINRGKNRVKKKIAKIKLQTE